MPKVAVTVDAKKAERKMRLLQAKLKSEGSLAVEEIGELGRSYAKSKAPYFSGKTFQNIRLDKVKGSEVIIRARNPTAKRADGFNLVRWMHSSRGIVHGYHAVKLPNGTFRMMRGGGGKHIRSGDPQFMYRTSSYLRKVAPGRVQGRFNKVVAQINNI